MVDMTSIEKSKENIQRTVSGRNAQALAKTLARDHPQRQADQFYLQNKFEERLAETTSQADRLSIYLEYVTWLFQALPEGPSRGKQIVPIVEKAVHEFFGATDFYNNVKLVKLWLVLVSCSPPSDRLDMFSHMRANGIGTRCHRFYYEYIKVLTAYGKIGEANEAFLDGFRNEVSPVESLRSDYEKFKAEHKEFLSKPQAASSRIPKPTQPAKPSSSKFAVFRDENEDPGKPRSSTLAGVPFPRELERRKENHVEPERNWAALSIPTTTTTSSSKPAEERPFVYKDPESTAAACGPQPKPSYRVELFKRGCSMVSFEQWRLCQMFSKVPLSRMKPLDPVCKLQRFQTAATAATAATTTAAAKKVHTASPTVNTKAAYSELMPMFSKDIVSSSSEEEPDLKAKPVAHSEKFQVYRDENLSNNENPFVEHDTRQPLCLSEITEEEDDLRFAEGHPAQLPESTPPPPKRPHSTPTHLTPISSEAGTRGDDQFSLTPVILDSSTPKDFEPLYCFTNSFFRDCLKLVQVDLAHTYASDVISSDFLPGSRLVLGDGVSFDVKERIGQDSLARTFKAALGLDEVTLKIQVPSCEWEYYVLQKIHSKLVYCRELVIRPIDFYLYGNCSVLVLEYGHCGTLLDCANRYLMKNESADEHVIVYLLLELLKVVNELHSMGIIHGDIRCENILVSDDCDTAPVKLFDFGRSLDTSVHNLERHRYFAGSADSDQEDTCVPARTNQPFTYELDYYGIASVAHVLLFQDYLRLSAAGTNPVKYSPQLKLGQRWNVEFWGVFFDFFINTRCPDGKPLLASVDAVIRKMQRMVDGCPNFPLLYNKHCWNMLNHK